MVVLHFSDASLNLKKHKQGASSKLTENTLMWRHIGIQIERVSLHPFGWLNILADFSSSCSHILRNYKNVPNWSQLLFGYFLKCFHYPASIVPRFPLLFGPPLRRIHYPLGSGLKVPQQPVEAITRESNMWQFEFNFFDLLRLCKCLALYCSDYLENIDFVYPTMSMIVIGHSLLY